MPRLFCVFALGISHFVGFVMPLLTYWMKFLHYTPGIYAEGYIVFVFPFVRSYIRWFVLPSRSWNYFKVLRATNKMTCAPSEDCTQWVAKSARFFMRTAKTDQTLQMPRLICVFCLRISRFVGFVMRLLTYSLKFLVL